MRDDDGEVSSGLITGHLEDILKSPAFMSSKRCQEFLRYVVYETVSGRADSIKERTIAIEVFGKGVEFEPSEDSLVRVKAREVRKRLAEYYKSGSESDLRIELPVGSYIPQIRPLVKPMTTVIVAPVPAVAPVIEEVTRPLHRRKMLWLLGGSLGALAVFSPRLFREHSSPLDLFWSPIFATKTPLLIFSPIVRVKGETSDWVGLGTTVAVSHAVEFLTNRQYPYHLRFGADLTYSQLREQPSLLLGGSSISQWTLRAIHDFRFTMVLGDEDGYHGGYIFDTQTKQKIGDTIVTTNGYADHDYAILSRLFDTTSGQIVMIAAGITTFGTESAAEFFFNPSLFAELVKRAPKDWETKNFEAVINISIVGTTPSSPRLVSTYFW